MADPKTSGPDPQQLLRVAEEALDAAEKVWPPPVPGGLYDAAESAVSKATPHLQAHTTARLLDRMNLLTRAEPIERVDVVLRGGRPVSVSTVREQGHLQPGEVGALFVREGDLLSRLQAMREHSYLPHEHEDTFDMGYRTALADVRHFLREARSV